jgi:AbrB family looped-hinge helix DNA binding protein
MAMVLFQGMKPVTVPIDQAGRIVLPKEVREDLAITPGDKFKDSVHGASVTLTPNKETAGFVRKGKALIFTTGGEQSLKQETANRALDESREDRHEK